MAKTFMNSVSPRHQIEACKNLRNAIHDLIDSGAILPPTPKPNHESFTPT